jgi:3-hydroxyacyl-[acyl-carrier-protein] dehydratase
MAQASTGVSLDAALPCCHDVHATMKFVLIDHILERTPERIVAVKQVSLAEEYLADHFPTFPILPGVLMVEAMVQAARAMIGGPTTLLLGEVKALKYGNMVRPGEALEVEVTLHRRNDDGSFACKGSGRVRRAGAASTSDDVAVSGRFTLRPLRP